MNDDGQILVNVDTAAKLLNCCGKSVIRLARAGKLPHVRIGNRWRFSPERLKAWVAEQEAASVGA